MAGSTNPILGILGTMFLGVSTAKILDFLLAFKEFDYSEADIARGAKVSARQVYRAIPILVNMGLIQKSRVSGRSNMYRLNPNSEVIPHFERLVFAMANKNLNSLKVWIKDPEEPETQEEQENQKELMNTQNN